MQSLYICAFSHTPPGTFYVSAHPAAASPPHRALHKTTPAVRQVLFYVALFSLCVDAAAGQILLDHQRDLERDGVVELPQIQTRQLLDLLQPVHQRVSVDEQLAGRFFNAFGEPIDGGPEIEGTEVEIGGPSVNPVRRKQPSELIATGIAGIDLNNTLVSGQKIPFFADPDQPFNQVMANVALRAETDKIILGGMGMTNDDYLYFKNVFSNAGALDRIISFVNTTENPPVERLLIPDMALTAAEYFAVEHNQKVLVLLTDMTSYADALAIVSNRMDQIPSKDSMPGSLYSDLAKIYEKAVQFPTGGSITIIAVTTLSGGDITHAVPDNTGYITEGQLFLRRDSDIGKVIVDPFRSLSRLKQLVSGKKTRKDHPQVMNAAVRLYADAANAKTKMENGFDLTNYDERALAFAKDYANQLLAIDVNLNTTEMLDVTWGLFSKYFKPEEVNIKKEFVDQYWKK